MNRARAAHGRLAPPSARRGAGAGHRHLQAHNFLGSMECCRLMQTSDRSELVPNGFQLLLETIALEAEPV